MTEGLIIVIVLAVFGLAGGQNEGEETIIIIIYNYNNNYYCFVHYKVGVNLESQSIDLPNIAIVSADQINGLVGSGLKCFTNDTVSFNIGQWTLPDNSIAQTSFADTVYNLRGPGSVTLYRTRQLTSDLEGIYTCTIPDTNNVLHVLYIGLYKQENYINGRLL